MPRAKFEGVPTPSLLPIEPMGFALWVSLVAIRLANALLLRTYFEPDEYWQSVEVAHKHIFGYGWLTWEWKVGVRSYFYLLPFLGLFKGLLTTGLAQFDFFIVYGPRMIQAISAATVDYVAYYLAYRIFGSRRAAEATLFMSVINWYNMAYAVRTLSNNLEVLLTLLTTLCWPIEPSHRFSIYTLFLGILFMGLSVLNRPSAVAHWIVPLITAMVVIPGALGKLRFIGLLLLTAILVIGFGIFIDWAFYGRFVLTWWTFLKVNAIDRISDFYGMSSWHFHLTQSLPMMMGTMLPLVVVTILSEQYSAWILQFLVGSVVFNSLLPHKETRFVLPAMPFLMMMAGQGYRVLSGANGSGWIKCLRRAYVVVLLVSNLAVGFYFARYHQSGVTRVMDYVRTEVDEGRAKGVYFIMPCHSTPFYGYLHRNIPMHFLTCDPPIGDAATNGAYHETESQRFGADPLGFLNKNVQAHVTHLVFFESMLQQNPEVGTFATGNGFRPCYRVFNTHFNPDGGRRGDVLAYCR